MNGDETIELIREYGEGLRIVAEEEERTELEEALKFTSNKPHRTYWVETPDGSRFRFGGYRRSTNSRRAGCFAALWDRAGEVEVLENTSAVPVKVANLGKPAIAAYLWTVHDLDVQEIAKMLDVGRRTIQQYHSKFRRSVR